MSDTSSSPSQESERNLPPGHSWLEIIKRRTPEAFAFAAAFTKDVILNASVLPRPISRAADLRTFFGATRAMYDTIAFKHEVTLGSRTYLEWEGTLMEWSGRAPAAPASKAGVGRLTEGARDVREAQHRSRCDGSGSDRRGGAAPAFSADLAGQLAEKMTVDPFSGSASRGHP
jgi:hypothetical protein